MSKDVAEAWFGFLDDSKVDHKKWYEYLEKNKVMATANWYGKLLYKYNQSTYLARQAIKRL